MNKILALIITNLCNFQCQTCLREYDRYENISLEIIKKVLPEAKILGYENVALTGGEPGLHPQFPEIIELLTNLEIKIGFVSNGSLLEKYKFLAEKYKDQLLYACFSLDGATPETNDLIRQKGSFKKALESIKYFISQGIHTKIIMCLNKLNLNQIEDVIKLGVELGVNSVNFSGIIRTPLNQKILLSDLEKVQAAAEIKNFQQKYKNIELANTSALQAMGGVDFCTAFNNLEGLGINPKGELVFCCDTIIDGAKLGSLADHSFYELYLKALDLQVYLKKIRAQMIVKREFIRGFNTCDFCNVCLENLLK